MTVFWLIVGFLAGAALLAVAGRVERATPGLAVRGSRVAACVWGALMLAWTVYGLFGLVRCERAWLGGLAAVAIACTGALSLVGPGLRARMSPAVAEGARVVALLITPLACLLMLEVPYSSRLFEMSGSAVRLNLAILYAAELVPWFVFQRRRSGLVAYAIACCFYGFANYFLCLFKGSTILPADLLALDTAAQVSAGYVFEVSDGPVATVIVFALFCALSALIPAGRLSRAAVARNAVCGLGVAACLMHWFATCDIQDDYGVKVDVWSTTSSYETYGSVPCFLQRLQEVWPEEPENYSTAEADRLQSELAQTWDEEHPGYPQTLEEAAAYQEALTGSSDLPSVVGVMNESFSDLSIYPGIDGYEGTDVFDGIDAQARGTVYTSARGGGTCNSEFEFLTGSTLGAIGGGVYPYMFYSFSGVEALPGILSALGYDTTAIHPAAATNWRRDVVYGQIGFDEFLSEDDFDEGADTLRDLITDRETYEKVLEVLADGADGGTPQFVFDVTLQNHGGYTTGKLEEDPYAGVTVNGVSVEGMSEYLTCVDASEEDLAWFLEQLEGLDQKVILVFFGDHQPGFNDDVAEASWGVAEDDETLDEVQQRFSTPYIIWANYDLGLSDEDFSLDDETSLGYLAARVCYAAGLPLTDQQKALLKLHEDMPAANLNGYMDAEGAWYWNGQDSDTLDVWKEYETLQFANLFDASGDGSFDDFRAARKEELAG